MAGFFYDILHEALQERLGIPLVWTPYPWTRCQENVKTGVADAMLTVPTDERASYTSTHKHPFYIKDLHVFTYAGHPRITDIVSIKTISDIKQFGFSVITYSGNSWHKSHVASLGIKTYETAYLENVWIMLAGKRGDLVIEWPGGAKPDLLRLRLEHAIIDTGTVLTSMPFHLLVRKGSENEAILDQFDATILAMQRDGTIDAIIKRYSL